MLLNRGLGDCGVQARVKGCLLPPSPPRTLPCLPNLLCALDSLSKLRLRVVMRLTCGAALQAKVAAEDALQEKMEHVQATLTSRQLGSTDSLWHSERNGSRQFKSTYIKSSRPAIITYWPLRRSQLALNCVPSQTFNAQSLQKCCTSAGAWASSPSAHMFARGSNIEFIEPGRK